MREGGTVLALDAASRLGWAVGVPGRRPIAGSEQLGRRGGTSGAVLAAALTWASKNFVVLQPSVIFIEMPHLGSIRRGKTSSDVLMRLLGIVGVFQAVAELRGIHDVRVINCADWRKLFIGNGNLPGDKAKDLSWRECLRRGWIDGDELDYDKTDALGIWAYGAETLRPGSLPTALEAIRTGDVVSHETVFGRRR